MTMKPKKALIVPTVKKYGRLKRHDQIPDGSHNKVDSWIDKNKKHNS